MEVKGEIIVKNGTRNADEYTRNRTVPVEMMPRAVDEAQVNALEMPDVENGEKKLTVVKWTVSLVRVLSN